MTMEPSEPTGTPPANPAGTNGESVPIGDLTGAVSVVVVADILFYRVGFGVNVGFMAVWAVLLGVLLQRNLPFQDKATPWVAGYLLILFASCIQSAVDTGIINAGILVVLICGGYRSRIAEACTSVAEHVARWLTAAWYGWHSLFALGRDATAASKRVGQTGRHIKTAVVVGLPAIVLSVLFILVLGRGNAIVGSVLESALEGLLTFFENVALPHPERVALWIGALVAIAVLLRPRPLESLALLDKEGPCAVAPDTTRLISLQCLAILIALNAIYLFTNTIDVIYLWASSELPRGVSYSAFVHRGVYALTAAVLIAAGVLITMFLMPSSVNGGRWMRIAAVAWIVQNLVLLVGVGYRLAMYIEVYWMTPKRFGVACFLLLVAVGFGFLAVYVWRHRSIGWLLGRNAIAAFALLVVIQFFPINQWVGTVNLDLWKENPKRLLGEAFFDQLGHDGWTIARQIAASGKETKAVEEAKAWLASERGREAKEVDRPWQAFQWRYEQQRRVLLATE